MTTAASGGQVSIVIEAVDRASRVIRNVSTSLRRQLASSVRSAAFSMLSFTTILSAAGIGIYQLVGGIRDLIGDIQATNRAAGLLSTQFRLAGFSADRAAASVGVLRENLSRTSLQALPGMDQALRQFLQSLTPSSVKEIETLAEHLRTAGISGDTFSIALEAAAGNYGPLEEALGIGKGTIDDWTEALEAGSLAAQEVERNMTPLEKLAREVSDRWSDAWSGMADAFNDAFGGNLTRRLIDNLRQSWDQTMKETEMIFGTSLIEAIQGAIRFVSDFFSGGEVEAGTGNVSDSPFSRMGKTFASQIVMGLVTWLIGEDAVKVLQLAWQGQWGEIWKKLEKIVTGWGEDIGRTIRDGLIKFILGERFGQLIVNALDSEGGLMGALKSLWPSGENWGQRLGAAIGNGLIGAIETTINHVSDMINDWIERVESVLNAIPGVSVTLGRVGGIHIPRISIAPETRGQNLQPPIPGQHLNSSGPNQIVIPVMVGGRQLDTIVVDVLNRSVRKYQPGLGIT